MYSTRTAYILWLPSLIGVAGLHRLYMGKVGSGILYLFTGGLFGLGTIYDAITMPDQIREVRLKARMRRALDDKLDKLDELDYGSPFGRRASVRSHSSSESPEHVILRVAKANHGIASPAQVALEGKLSTDDAREQLDRLVDKGIGEVRVRKSGSIAYVFPDFLDDTGAADLERF
ncbi:MAG: TM2 domain-containing protein [Spirochaetota bacterium]